MKAKFLAKTTTDVLEDKIKYSQKLIDVIEKETSLASNLLNYFLKNVKDKEKGSDHKFDSA